MKKLLIILVFLHSSLYAPIDLIIVSEDVDKNVELTVGSHRGAGLFCELRKVVSSIIHYESEEFNSIYIDWTSPYFPYTDSFSSKDNGWDLFFEPITIQSASIDPIQKATVRGFSFHEIHGDCSAQWVQYERYLPYRRYVKSIIDKYIHIKPFILDQVEDFYQKKMGGFICIGVQARLSRHVCNRASLEEYAQEIDRIIKNHTHDPIKIFVATDTNKAIRFFKQRYGDKAIYSDAWRKENEDDPIFDSPRFQVGSTAGIGAIKDCLLLARCDYFIHIISNLSNFVSFYNPHIQSIFLPKKRPYKHCDGLKIKGLKNPFLNP